VPRTLTDTASAQPALQVGQLSIDTAGSAWVASSKKPLPAEVDTQQVTGGQQLLFGPAPQAFCDEIGLSWSRALDLYRDGFLSFSPAMVQRLDEVQETELRFLGTLVQAGCDRLMLSRLLRGLSYPYSYDLGRIYYNWRSGQWLVTPEMRPDPETTLTEWLDVLVRNNDADTLTGIIELAREALHRMGREPK
jgi:hypothetical protein